MPIKFAVLALLSSQLAIAQLPTYHVGRAPTAQEIKEQDTYVGPSGEGLPQGRGTAKEGAKIFAQKCALCHGKDGEGVYNEHGETVFPPLWGPRSFNIGAGMARVNTAAAFVKANMPFGQDNTLTDQEAFDVSVFFTHQPRPDFEAKQRLAQGR